jgi:tripartite-type tricarboxylate transporter receptor subunit TctC
VVVENLPGAGGIPGTQQIVKAPRDGFTLGLVSNNHVVNPSIYKSMPYDAVADITPVTVIGSTPFVLAAHPSVPAKNIPELLALARARPGALNYASSGNGTIIQLAAEMLRDEAKIDIRHIPYRGTGPMVTDLLGGQVQLGVLAINVAMPHLKSGALRALGLTSAKRSPLLPELPAIAEQGLPRYAIEGWIAVIGPAGLGRADTDRIYRAFKETVETPEVRDVLLAQGYTLQSLPPDATAAWFRSERDRMAALVRQAGVKID